MRHDELRVAIRKGVNRELRMYGFRNRSEAEHSLGLTRSGNRSSGVRAEIFEIAVLDSTNELTNQSSEQDILRVTRRHVRRLVAEVNRRRDIPLDPAGETDTSDPCFVGNGVFPLSSLAARHHKKPSGPVMFQKV